MLRDGQKGPGPAHVNLYYKLKISRMNAVIGSEKNKTHPQLHSHTSTSLLIIGLYIVAILSSALINCLYFDFQSTVIGALSCGIIEILNNVRLTAMRIMQTIGFFVCLLLAFLGVKYAN